MSENDNTDKLTIAREVVADLDDDARAALIEALGVKPQEEEPEPERDPLDEIAELAKHNPGKANELFEQLLEERRR